MRRFEHAVVNRAHVLRLHGEFTVPDPSELADAIAGCHTAGTPCVVVNWAGVTRWNSIGLGGVIAGEGRIRELGGHYRNCALTTEAKGLLAMLKLAGFSWNLFEAEAEAVLACPESTLSDD